MSEDNINLLFWVIQIMLIILKLGKILTWSWWIILSPLLVIIAIGAFLWLMDNL